MTGQFFKNPINIIGIALAIFGLYYLIDAYNWHKKWSIKTGDPGAFLASEFHYDFKNSPKLNRPMDAYEISTHKEFKRYELESRMRDGAIVLALGVIILIFGARNN